MTVGGIYLQKPLVGDSIARFLREVEPVDLLRLIRTLWESTESYRALYYNDAAERDAAAVAHERIMAAVRAHDASALVAELDAHRERALEVLRRILD